MFCGDLSCKIAREFAKAIKSEDIKLILLFGSVTWGGDDEEYHPIASEIKAFIQEI